MADLEAELLTALLSFARARLEVLLSTLADDAGRLLLTVVPGASAADQALAAGTAADTELATARTHLAAFAGDLATPPTSLGECQAAFGELAQALAAVDRAIQDIAAVVPAVGSAEDALTTVVRSAVAAGGDAVTGLLDQLGLGGGSVSSGISHTGTVLSYPVANAAARSLDPVSGAILKLDSTTASANLDYGGATPNFGMTVSTGLAIGLSADGFVDQVVGADASATATLTVAVDIAHGLRFQAGAKGRADLDGQLSLPGVELRGLGIEIPDGVPLGLALTGTLAGSFGPIAAVIQGAGVSLAVDPSQIGGGNPFTLALQPPTGAGLTVDAGVIQGGGYVQHQGAEYGGALDLSLGPIEIKAVGLVGTDPFSLVLVLSVTFTPAIQLSFGFTLNAVGGLLALERTIATDVLRAGIRDHTADTVLFPEDPVAAAPTILQLLRAIFPPQQGAFVAGPMLELGWGAPISFVTARLGVVIALPDPKVILIGSLRVALPDPDVPIVDLRADLYGEITPDHLLFLVSLSGSRLASFTVTGDFGLLIAWGDDPDFALSAGGFHPELPATGRAGRDATGGRRPVAALDHHAAGRGLPGADVELLPARHQGRAPCRRRWRRRRGAPAVRRDRPVGADVPLRDRPVGRGLPLRVRRDLRERRPPPAPRGPGQWVVSGSASISLLFFDVDLDIPRITWGSGNNPVPDPVDPMAMVTAALSDPAAWAARLPADTDLLVRLAPLGADEVDVVHPLGALEAREHQLPLETVIDHVGSHPVNVPRVNLGQPTLNPGTPQARPATAISAATDLFAPGNFLALTDDQKLSRPAFEPFPAGIVLAAETAMHGTPSATAYEWYTVVPPVRTRTRQLFTSMAGLHAALLAVGPAGQAQRAGGNPYAVAADPAKLADPGQARVRSTVDLGVVAGVVDEVMSTTNAAQLVSTLPAGTAQWVGAGVGAGAGI